jgi:hypothetical protein
VRRELGSPAAAHACLGTVETVVGFLTSTGGGLVQRLDAGVVGGIVVVVYLIGGGVGFM